MNRRMFFGRLLGTAMVAKVAPDVLATETLEECAARCFFGYVDATHMGTRTITTNGTNTWGNVLIVAARDGLWESQANGSWKRLTTTS